MHQGLGAGRTVRVPGPVVAGVVAPTASCRREGSHQGRSAGNHGVPGDGPKAMPTTQPKESPTEWQRVGATEAASLKSQLSGRTMHAKTDPYGKLGAFREPT